jgi:hypothetical protein
MKRAPIALRAAVLVTGLLSACSLPFLDRWDAKPAVVHSVPADADVVWRGVTEAVEQLGLVVEEVRPEARLVQLTWITRPGDGRAYLRCRGGGPIGSASLRPRILVRTAEAGSEIEISSIGRATAGSGCVSTGEYERWLLEQIEPALAAALREGK